MSEDFRPTATWEVLRLRSELLRRTREFFHTRGFLEVETPILSQDVVVDRHLDPLAVVLPDDVRRPQIGQNYWLQTSPEFGMKRLMASGAEAIYQITKVFRGGEQGRLHNPEFTMIEWYRRGDSYLDGMNLLADLAMCLFEMPKVERMSYADAFHKHVGIDPHRATDAELLDRVRAAQIVVPQSERVERDLLLDLLLTERIDPHLGTDAPLVLYDYPASQSALAQVRATDPPVAERFELYWRGVELANGYHELLDPQILRDRNAAANLARKADGKPQLPVESRLLDAMEHSLPACCGCALGFDRAVMLAAGKSCLADVLAFPIDLA